MKTRLSVLPDERKIILGMDKLGIFKAGVVYEVTEMLGEIVLTPIGKYALEKDGQYPNENSQINSIIISGLHLITEEEFFIKGVIS